MARVKAAATDPEARQKAIHERRFFRRWSDRDGALQAHLYGHLEDGASMWRVLDPIRRRLAALREQGSERTERDLFQALDYDALVAMTEIASGKEGELCLADLLELGLFPQLEPEMLAGREHRPAPSAGAARPGPISQAASPEAGAPGPVPDPTAPAPEPGGAVARSVPVHAPGAGADPDPPRQGDTSSPDLFSLLSEGLSEGLGKGPSKVPDPSAGAGSAAPSGSSPKRRRKLAGSPLQVMVRVDLDTLLRGVAIDGELCEIAGYGPVPVSVIEKLAANDNAFVVGVLTKSKQVLGIYHARRRPNAHQISALRFVYPSCAAAGCSSKAGLQSDHREDWARTKFTVFDLLDRLCPHHHRLKTNHGWQLVEGSGKRAFVPPSDPRHPARVAGVTRRR